MLSTLSVPPRHALCPPLPRASALRAARRAALARRGIAVLRAPCRPTAPLHRVSALASDAGDDAYITSEAAFAAHIASAPVVVADFMARWCRKCIYVKPRLATLMSSKFKNVPIAYVDVNAVPSAVVRGAGVSKMPTICVYVHGEQVDAYVAGESATTAVLKLESMIEAALKKAKDGAPAT